MAPSPALLTQAFNTEPWVILSPIERSIKQKIEAIGTPLKDWKINIYRGITTGFNDAFIIDGTKKNELITADPKSAEIIRPILRGRDIKRYAYEFADLYLVTTFPSLNIDIEKFPAVKAHLLSFGYNRLKQTGDKNARKKTNNQWFETQDSISYWEDFYKQKIVYPDLMRLPQDENVLDDHPRFYYDNDNSFFLCNDIYFITGDDLDLIYLFLASDIGFYVYSKFYMGLLFDSTGFRYNKAYMDGLFVPRFDEQISEQLRTMTPNVKDNMVVIEKLIEDFIRLNEVEKERIRAYKKHLLSIDR